MEKKAYPTIFTPVEDAILVEVPDLGIVTQGDTYPSAIAMARDAIGLMGITMEDEAEEIPEPSDICLIDVSKGVFAKEGRGYVSLVDIDFLEYRRKVDNKMVRRNVTLPNWLNQEAEKAHLNVSKVLQEALKVKLGVDR